MNSLPATASPPGMIQNDHEYRFALALLDCLTPFNPPAASDDGRMLVLLIEALEQYEEWQARLPPASPD